MNTEQDVGRVGKPTGLSQVEPASGLEPTAFDPSRSAGRIAMAAALAPYLDVDVAGELLRALCFADEGGCHTTFDVVDGFEEVAPETLSLPVRTALAGCWAKDPATVRRMTGYVHKESGLGVAWYWDGDGTLVFKRGDLFIHNSDCKKDYGWESSAPGDWIHTYRGYDTGGGNYPCDSDGPRMAETNEDSARGEAGPARAEGIAQGHSG